MTRFSLSGSFPQCRLLILGLLAFSACRDTAPLAPSPSGAALARSAGGGKGPTVTATNPDSATVETTLNVHVLGSGYDVGSRANWALKGVVNDKVVTHSTQFVSSTELVANITIARDAPLASYDVIVTTSSGKGGIGTELFVITAKATALPTLGSGASATGINDGGTIIGVSADAAGVWRPVKWTFQGGGWTVAQLPGGFSGSALGINASGDIVGRNGAGATQRALIWPAGGSPVVLGCPSDLAPDVAEAINTGGAIAGYRGADDGGLQVAAVWRPGHCREELPALAAGKNAEARGIDDAGIVSGHAYDAAGTEWAVRWTFNGISWNPPEKLKDGVWAGAWATNGPGDIAGGVCVGVFPGCPAHAFLWPYPGTLVSKDLGTLGGRVSAAFALSKNEVVGWSYTSQNISVHAFIWSATTGMRDLGPLKFDNHSEAHGVNNSRQVIGFSSGKSGQHAVVWIVP